MKDIWNAIKSIFVNDAHTIVSKRGKEILAEHQKAIEWFAKERKKFRAQAKGMENKRINLPIHIHEGVENIHVYVENGVIHVKRND